MNEYFFRSEEQRWCYFHPREMVIGICALCLKERLSVLAASKQAHIRQTHNYTPKKLLPKFFALKSLINPLDIKHHKSDDDHELCDDTLSSTSQEESFISIKFEDNGVASWDKGQKNSNKISNSNDTYHHEEISDNGNNNNNNNRIKSVVEHAKPRTALRWRKRIGHIVQLIRWKRSITSKGNSNVCHVGTKLEGAKVKHGWIRILTKRRTKE